MDSSREGSLKFNSPQEEIAYLREQVVQREKELAGNKESFSRDQVVVEKLIEHIEKVPEEAIAKPIKPEEKDAIVLDLAPKSTDKKIEELLGILEARGLLNTLKILEHMHDPVLEDDFHRVLIQFIKKNLPVSGVSEKSSLFYALRMTLFEITLPFHGVENKKPLKELISAMEQLYVGIIPQKIGSNDRWFSFEIAVSNEKRDVVFYAAVPDELKSLFEKQILSAFPDAKIAEEKNDYNVFKDKGFVAASRATYKNNPIFRIKYYSEFDYDPLNFILNAFSKIKDTGEGAAIQFLVSPPTIDYVSRYKQATEDLDKGKALSDAIYIPENAVLDLAKDVKGMVGDFIWSHKEKKEEKKADIKIDQAKEAIKQKIETPIVSVGIRIVTSSETEARAKEILKDIEAAFNQFESTSGNAFLFKPYEKSDLQEMVKNFSFRVFDKKEAMPLSTRELSTIFHLPTESAGNVSELKQAKAGTAPAPSEMGKSGIILGLNRHRNLTTEIHFAPEDRLRHFYAIGQTGTGKSTLLKSMIMQDIRNGEGVCMIDPHGSDIEDVLASIPPEREKDVIYFDPAYMQRPMGLNMLEYDERFPEQKTFVVNELISIFNKLFDMKVTGGPAFEQYFRNSALLVMEHPPSGNTLIEIGRVLGDKQFRDLKLSYCKNPIIKQFWQNAEKSTGEQSLSNFVPYITSKFDNFISNDIMRPVVAQEKSSFNLRDIMDKRKILLVNLSKGRLGDINANLIGLVLVGKILMAALSRVDSFGQSLPTFYLYIDEFQNITTDSIATILSEARKYKLSLTIAHQFIAQLEEKIRDAVFGNVGSLTTFRVGADDAEYLKKQFEPVFNEKDIMNLDNYNAYIKLLIGGRPSKAFNFETYPMPQLKPENAARIKENSYQVYGRNREEVEASIMARYQKA